MQAGLGPGAKCVVLLSGGLDSTVLAAHLRASDIDVIPFSVNYGSRHNEREWRAAQLAAIQLALPLPVRVQVDRSVFHSNVLTDHSLAIPEGHYEDESMRATVCPNRNMVMLSLAAAFAISRDASYIAYAAHYGDHAIYPDCRVSFIQAMANALTLCHYEPVHLLTPFAEWLKADIVAEGARLNAPLGITYSCYNGRELHCGRCGTCIERREAFSLAGVVDPTRYEV
jgi:7-cyano-7-deazaguanine synthase